MSRREFPDRPIVGVGAVILDSNCIPLVRRGNQPLKGEWSLPGGALKLGETLEAGVCREVLEETGLKVRVVAMVEVMDKIVWKDAGLEDAQSQIGNDGSKSEKKTARRVRYHYVLVDFLCVPAGGVLQSGTDAMDARWVENEELNSDSGYRLAPATLAVIHKALALAKTRS